MREPLRHSTHCLRRRPSGTLARLAPLRLPWPAAAGWTRRLRALAPGRDSSLIDCLSTASRSIAASGALALGVAALRAGDRRQLAWSLGYAGCAVTLVAVGRRRDGAGERTRQVPRLLDVIAPAAFAALAPSLLIVALPAYVSALAAGALAWGNAAIVAAIAATLVAWIGGAAPETAGGMFVIAPAIVWSAANERRRRAESAAADRLASHARGDRGFTASLQAVLEDLLRLFGARSARLLTHDETTGRSFIGELDGSPAIAGTLRWREVTDLPDADSAAAGGTNGRGSALCIPFQAEDWSGSLLLVDPAPGRDCARAARFLSRAAHELMPALVSLHSLTRLRTRIEVRERTRLERELHDSVIQSLIAAEMRLAVAGRTSRPAGRDAEVARAQQILRQEIFGLRDFMRQLKPLDVDPEELAPAVAELVDRFGRETGIAARFSTAGGRPHLNRRACAELVRIVQEALTNVRKHSGARHVHVRLAFSVDRSVVFVEDDGRGFPRSRTPAVIRDSVRLLDGRLAIESAPGEGAHLTITIPADAAEAASRFDRWMAS